MRVSCATPSMRNMPYHALHPYILHTHGIWQVTLRSMLDKSVMCYTLHFTHTHTHNTWQVMLRNMPYNTLHPYMLHTHGIWQMTLRSMLNKSIMHHTHTHTHARTHTHNIWQVTLRTMLSACEVIVWRLKWVNVTIVMHMWWSIYDK